MGGLAWEWNPGVTMEEQLSPDLPGGGGVGPQCHRGAVAGARGDNIQQAKTWLCVKMVTVEGAHVRVPEGGAVPRSLGVTSGAAGKPGLHSHRGPGLGARGADRACARKRSGASGWGEGPWGPGGSSWC